MKIRAIQTYPLQAAVSVPFVNPYGRTYTQRTALLVCVETDEGLQGWGETGGPLEATVAGIRDVLEPRLVGRDPSLIRALWAEMDDTTRRAGGALGGAVGAIEMALWDLQGQATGQPIVRLLGVEAEGWFPAVATAVFYDLEVEDLRPRTERAERLAADGLRGIKVKVGRLTPAADLHHLQAIRAAVGTDVMLCVDANNTYNPRTALDVAERMREVDVYWFEEPFPVQDTAGYRRLAEGSPVRLAGGQGLPSPQAYLPLLEARALHIAQSSVPGIGGFAEAQGLVTLAQAFGARYLPTGWGTGVLIAASLHMRAATRAVRPSPFPDLDWMEIDVTPNPLREAVVDPPMAPKDGHLEVPTGPGLGVRVNADALRHFAAAH